MTFTRQLSVGVFAAGLACVSVGCKPQQDTDALSAKPTARPAQTATPHTPSQQQAKQRDINREVTRTGLTPVQWFLKQNISSEESRTVDALIESAETYGAPSGKPADIARWSERNMQVVSLDGKKLTNISPILVFKNISTLFLIGNNFSQAQVDELILGLPKLKTLALNSGLNCEARPGVICLH